MNTAALAARRTVVAPHGMLARIFLSFLATAGFFYVNIMPALVSGLIDGLGFSAREAGLVSAANVYGAAAGALLIVFVVGRVHWRPVASGLLAALMLFDIVSMTMREAQPLMVIRFLHGFVGGVLVGLTYSIIARTQDPDRTFGVLLVVQFGLGGVGILVLPPLVPLVGVQVLFIALIAFALTALVMMRFLDDYPPAAAPAAATAVTQVPRWPLVLTLLCVFLFQAANMGLSAFIIEIARAEGLTTAQSGPALAVANWLGIVGAGIVVVVSARFGRTAPLMAGIVLTAIGSWFLHMSESTLVYFLANAVVAITWAMVIAYLLGMCAQLRSDGRIAVIGGFVSKLGLASGPAAFAWFVQGDNYSPLIDVSVVALVVCGVACLAPTKWLDRRRAAKN